MKGSWFIFDTYRAHEDWCRWRAPFWHGTKVTDSHSHANYHLSFRCCNSIGKTNAASSAVTAPNKTTVSVVQMNRSEPVAARRQLQSLGLLPSAP